MESLKITQFKRFPKVGKNGEYFLTMFVDGKNRKISTFGDSSSWKVGDVVEMEVVEKPGFDKQGNSVVYLNASFPSKKSFPSQTASVATTNPILEVYKLAASLAILFYKDAKKAPKLSDIDDLVAELQKRINPTSSASTPVAEVKVPKISLDEEDEIPKAAPVQQTLADDSDDDDEKPF